MESVKKNATFAQSKLFHSFIIMKIVISPAKSLNFEKKVPTEIYTQPFFQEQASQINVFLRKMSPKQLATLMHISEKLADLNWGRNQSFSLPFTIENARQAVYAFDGDVYEGLDVYSIDNQRISKMQDSLRILSGLYGILKPLDLIQPYRLEMGTKLNMGDLGKDLYVFWKEQITLFLNKELKNNELFINLASNEYFNVIDTKLLNAKIITPIFKDWKGNELKTISFFAKKARGLMVRFLIENDIESAEDLKGFNYGGYTYSEEHSHSSNELVFVR